MKAETEVRMISVDKVIPSPFQPRESFQKESLEELGSSMRESGLVQPILVRRMGDNFQIVAGERRWRASKLAGLKMIPAIIRDIGDIEARELSLIENWHREDLADAEREKMVYSLWVEGKKSGRYLSPKDMARKFGVSRTLIDGFIKSWEDKKAKGYPLETPTFVMRETRGLEEEVRKEFVSKIQRGDVRKETLTVREYVRVLKESPKPVQKAILKPKSRITPIVAKKVLKLPKKSQTDAINQIESLRLEEDEAISHIEALKIEVPLPPPEELEKIRERYEQLQKEFKAKLATPEARERGELFRNWTSHIAVAGILDSISCPICKSKQLGWICHELTIQDALAQAEKKYKRRIPNKKRERSTESGMGG